MLNQVILVGRLTAIVKKKGKIESFKVIVPRINELEKDRPIVVVPPEIGESIYGLIKDDIVVGVKARIETEVKGGFGTVTKIVAQKITVLNKTEDQMDTDRIRKVAKEHGEEVVGALMMDMMGLSDNPLTHYFLEENLGDEDMVNSVSKAFANALKEERTELRSVLPKEGTIGPITGERVPIEKE